MLGFCLFLFVLMSKLLQLLWGGDEGQPNVPALQRAWNRQNTDGAGTTHMSVVVVAEIRRSESLHPASISTLGF